MRRSILLSLCIGFFLLFYSECIAQSGISVGFGIPEYLHIDYKWHNEQTGYSFALGTLPGSDEFLLSGRLGFLYHFYGRRNYSLIKSWYINPGVAYNAVKAEGNIDQYLMLDMRIGREFSINHSWGVFTELGAMYIFWKKTENANFNFVFNYDSSILPTLNLGLYYRFPLGCNCPKIKTKP